MFLGDWSVSFSRGSNDAIINNEGPRRRAEDKVEIEGEYMGTPQEMKKVISR